MRQSIIFFALFAFKMAFCQSALTGSNPTFEPLDFCQNSALRTASGKPSAKYWQQKVDYQIYVTLDTLNHSIDGNEKIIYHNNSPDTLDYLWIQLDQNIYKEGSIGSLVHSWRVSSAHLENSGGYKEIIVQSSGKRLNTMLNGTMMRVNLLNSLPPGNSTTLEVTFSFLIPENGSERTGRMHSRHGWVYQIAQWYPRLAVYDDLNGWNIDQYLGQGEFYLEYGNFDVLIKVPRNVIVAGTGVLTIQKRF
jgi:hypothetical protein